jgi:hypothetical protein
METTKQTTQHRWSIVSDSTPLDILYQISNGSWDRASTPRTAWLSLAVTLSLRDSNPPIPGPRGWRMIVGLSAIPFWTVEGRLGTGGIDPLPKPELAKRDPNPPGERRDGEAIVAYPSRMFPLEDRVFSRGTGFCSDFMSGMDFLARSRWVKGVVLVGVRYAEGVRESVWRGCCR